MRLAAGLRLERFRRRLAGLRGGRIEDGKERSGREGKRKKGG